jgi:serine/threonine protein kinase
METLYQPGDIIRDRYQIQAILGYGGTGMTYAAMDLQTQTAVAVKVLSLRQLTDWKLLELFEREARVLENLDHPFIPDYVEHFHQDVGGDRRFFLVQELAAGKSLADLVEQGWRATEKEVQEIAVQVLDILNYLHWLTPPVIHRDIKPQNLIRRQDGKVFLVDFGAVRDTYRHTLTSGTFVGTLGYMPPEQFRGQAFFATDLYALGATLLFLLTHRSPADLPQKRLKLDFRDRIQVSAFFADWLEKMLEPLVEDRFHSAQEALQALQQQAIHPTELVPLVPSTPRFRQPKHSQLKLERRGDRLWVKVPPLILTSPVTVIVFGFLAFWFLLMFGQLFFVAITSFSAASLGQIFFILLFLGPLTTIGSWFLLSSSYLAIDRQRFALGWKFLQLQQWRSGKTDDITKVQMLVNVSSKGRRTTRFVLWEGVRQHTLRIPTEVEQQWLVAEVEDFLMVLRNSDQP